MNIYDLADLIFKVYKSDNQTDINKKNNDES